jgi:hypothetical protein
MAANEGHQRAENRFEEGEIAEHPVRCPGETLAVKALWRGMVFCLVDGRCAAAVHINP